MGLIMRTVKVIFENDKYNFSTPVNPKSTDEAIKKYFVGAYFNVGTYLKENMQKCINIEIKRL